MMRVYLTIGGGVAEAVGLLVTVMDLRNQQRRLAKHQDPPPSLGPPEDPLQAFVGRGRAASSPPWHHDQPSTMFNILERVIDQERDARTKADQAVVKYLDKRVKTAVEDIDRRRVVGDAQLRELLGVPTDWKVYRGPAAFVLGLFLNTLGSI